MDSSCVNNPKTMADLRASHAKGNRSFHARHQTQVEDRLNTGLYALQCLKTLQDRNGYDSAPLEVHSEGNETNPKSNREPLLRLEPMDDSEPPNLEGDQPSPVGEEFRSRFESQSTSDHPSSRKEEFRSENGCPTQAEEHQREEGREGPEFRQAATLQATNDEEFRNNQRSSGSEIPNEESGSEEFRHDESSSRHQWRSDDHNPSSEEDDDDGDDSDPPSDGENEQVLSPDRLIEMILFIYITHNISVKGMTAIVRLINDLLKSVRTTGTREWSKPLPAFRAMKYRANLSSPNIKTDYEYHNKEDGRAVLEEGARSLPLKLFAQKERFGLLYTFTYMSLKDLVIFHKKQHEIPGNEIILAFDNVPVNKSSGESFDVVSVQFPTCHRVYPYRIFHGARTVKMNQFLNLSQIMHEVLAMGLRVKHIISDLPKRASLMGLIQHGGYYACSNCLVPGQYANLSGTMVYPINRSWPQRTTQAMRDIVDDESFAQRASQPERHRERLLGLKSRTPLFDLPGFDLVTQTPIDEMHNIFLGVVRKLMYRTFKVGEASKGQTEPRMTINYFNQIYLQGKVPFEQLRKTREFNVFWKASEFRALVVMHFPLLFQCLLRHPSEHKKALLDIWCSLTFVVLYVHRERNLFNLESAREALVVFKNAYTRYFGEHSINLNVHLFCHLLETHALYGDLNEVSTIRSEAMYQTILKCFHSGTRNVATQAMTNVYLKYQLSHSCERRLHYRTKETGRTQDNYIYTIGHRIYRVTSILENHLLCKEIVFHQP